MSDTITPMYASDASCLALVQGSPLAVAAHDKAAWLALFARYNVVEDPVGAAALITGTYDAATGYRGTAGLSRFFDTFIAPNTIRFHVYRDIVCGLHVVRDLTIEIAMSAQVVVHVPAHLLYELTIEDNDLKIFRLAAHWEFWPMLKQQMGSGWPFVKVGSASSVRLLRHMGIFGMAGYMRALSSVGDPGKAQVVLFARYFNAGTVGALAALFTSPEPDIAFPHGAARKSLAACTAQGGEMVFSKVLAAGNVVSATLAYSPADQMLHGVAIFELDRRSLQIVALSFYWSESV